MIIAGYFLSGVAYSQVLDELGDIPVSETPISYSQKGQIRLADESEEPDSGNWYEKLRWWKEARALYTVDIKAAIDELDILKEEFDSKKNDILLALDRYSAALPVKRQAAEHVIDDLLNDLIKRQEALAQERTRTQVKKNTEETTELEVHQKMLNELRKEFEDFNILYQRLKQTFDVVIPAQIQNAHNFSARALAAYEAIEQTLDDKKAHRLFNEVENGLENIQAISAYLKGPLWNFMDKAWTTTEQLMPKITKSITNLEEKGVVVRPLTAQEKTQMVALEAERKIKREQQEIERKAEKEWQNRSWWQKAYLSVGSLVSYVGSGTWYILTRPYIWISALFSKSEQKNEKPNQGSAPKKTEPISNEAPLPLPSKLPITVSGSLAPQQDSSIVQAPIQHINGQSHVQKEPVRVIQNNEVQKQQNTTEVKKAIESADAMVDESPIDDEEAAEEPEDGDESDDEESTDESSDEAEGGEEPEEESKSETPHSGDNFGKTESLSPLK